MRPSPKKAFTLTEVLVAVALLAMVLGLLLPVFQRIRGEQFAKTRCMANLRESALAVHLMTADRNGIFRSFARGNAGTGDGIWGMQLYNGGYIKDRRVLRCPRGASQYALEEQAWYWNSYGFNMATATGDLTAPAGNSQSYSLHFGQVRNPARRPMLVDSSTLRFISPGVRSETFRVNINKVSDGVQFRHEARALAVFMDGHVEALDREGAQAFFNPEYFYEANSVP